LRTFVVDVVKSAFGLDEERMFCAISFTIALLLVLGLPGGVLLLLLGLCLQQVGGVVMGWRTLTHGQSCRVGTHHNRHAFLFGSPPVGHFLTFPVHIMLEAITVTTLLFSLCSSEDIHNIQDYISDPAVCEQILAYQLDDFSLYFADFL
jgi:hypothetical protein